MITFPTPTFGSPRPTALADPPALLAWQPALNVYRCADHYIVCLDLAGTDPREVELTVTAHRLQIRGARRAVQPPGIIARQVLAMEIDQGPFERTFDLPLPVSAAGVQVEQHAGLLWITLPLRKK